ncbi:MAG TPA: ribonuclease E inhibitor RraB [Gaiellaceae bacterium]|jgi:Regulator of ribonuclease activity B|nr:ribonuclease E inhibitor RraB [Gaiellaceae bacterium]
MRLFSRKKDDDDEPVDLNERSPELGLKYKDLAVLGQLMKAGADLTQPRHVVFYSYAPSEQVGQALKADIEAGSYTAEIREPLPQAPGQWAVVAETHAVTSPDFVREADDFFQALADRHGADYDGWEASV